MSTGHSDDVPEPSGELRALLTTEVMCAIAALVAEAQVVRGYQVPYVFGASEDGKRVYPSSDVPEKLSDGEHEFHSDAGCAWHELGEWYLMERLGLVYDDAHSLVTWCVERPVVEGIMGLDFAGYQAAFEPYIIADETERLLVCPPDLYMRPYLADAAPALVAAIRAAQARASLKVAKGSDDQPRDEHGRWSPNRGEAPQTVEHPVHGVISYAGVTDDEWHTWAESSNDINDARSGELKAGMVSQYGTEVSKENVARLKDIGDRIQAAASTYSVEANALWRGESYQSEEELRDRYKIRQQVTTDRLTSVAVDRGVAVQYATTEESAPVRAIVEYGNKFRSMPGVQTAPLGTLSKEVVMPAGVTYRVAGIRKGDDGVFRISMYSTEKFPHRRVPLWKPEGSKAAGGIDAVQGDGSPDLEKSTGADDQPRDEQGRFASTGGGGPENLRRVETGDKVDGLVVRNDVPNTSSISASMSDNHESLGVREVPFSEFTGSPAKNPSDRIRDLAEQIKESGEINPLIVVYESFNKEEGPYVLEGSHRFDALGHLGKKSFPAMVVIDHGDEAQQAGKAASNRNKDKAAEKGADMNDKRLSFFLPFGKVEKTDDGCRMVSGYASTPTLDLDGEIVSLECVKAALPDYMEWRSIRQMHQPLAVGVAKEANVDDVGLFLRAKIVDPACVRLIDEGVLKGYSVGGKKVKQDGNTITEMELIEISVVDRPANPDCRIEVMKGARMVGKRIELVKAAVLATKAAEPTFDREEVGFLGRLLQKMSGGAPPVTTPVAISAIDPRGVQDLIENQLPAWLNKRDVSDKERDVLADQGKALPDGSFPIATKSDLENAVQAHGRAKNPARAKRHIIRRAKALGATHLLPAEWPGSTKDREKLAAARASIQKGANFYTVSSMIELLGRLEYAEECCEGENGFCCYGQGETSIQVGKDFTDKFGTLLVEFGDMVADLLDRLLSEMADEEREEAAGEAEKVAKRLRMPVEKGKPTTLLLQPSDGDDTIDVVAALAAIVKTSKTGGARTGPGDVFAQLQQAVGLRGRLPVQ